jgi:hypothetical protein
MCCLVMTACGRFGGVSKDRVVVTGSDGSRSAWTNNASNPKVTQANAELIETGQSESEVNKILGQPMYSTDQAVNGKRVKISVWQNADTYIAITYEDGRVQSKVAAFP